MIDIDLMSNKEKAEYCADSIPVIQSTIATLGDELAWLEVPVAKAVDALNRAGLPTCSSGFFYDICFYDQGLKPNFAICIDGVPLRGLEMACANFGLKVTVHPSYPCYYIHTDGIPAYEWRTAKVIFDRFAMFSDRIRGLTIL